MSQIVAISDNFAIGKENKLLWHFPEDLKYFKINTSHKIMIMGRKTFDSLGKPLPHRFHIVISKSVQQPPTGAVQYVSSIEEAVKAAQIKVSEKIYPEEVMVVGGAEIYKQMLSICDKLYVTRIPGSFEADAFYPKNFSQDYKLVSDHKSEMHPGLHYEIWQKSSK